LIKLEDNHVDNSDSLRQDGIGVTIREMLARNARMYANDIALVQVTPSQNKRQVINWKEFDEKANKVSDFLVSRGIRKDDKILLMMRNCIDFLVAYFGILGTGAWVVPLNFRFDSQDIKFCAHIAEPKYFILEEEFVERVESVRSELHSIEGYIVAGQTVPQHMEGLEKEIQNCSATMRGIELKDEDACALYFTSGTTGTPKPIIITHKNLEHAAISSAFRRNDRHDDISLVIGPLYHTGAMIHWLGNLIVGGRGVLLIDRKISPHNMLDTINKESITEMMVYVPWILDLLLALEKGELRKEDYNLSQLRLMHLGAQAVPFNIVERWKKHFPDVAYIETYGLSETTGPGCIWIVGIEKKKGLLGRPGFNWEARVVNEQEKDVVPGEIGEIIVKGNGVMKEYYKNPQETAKALKNGWLYTGDLGKVDDEGLLYIADRKKDVIISGGENIFPADVESVILNHPKVYDAALIGVPDDRLGELAIAVVAPKPGLAITEDEMREFSEKNLPRYRRPRGFVFDEVPRSNTGKIQRYTLREKCRKILEK
jgi:acyl-CoA synthetase (AMP-forming)/AMP-acid ligase II